MNSRVDNITVIFETDKLFAICKNYLDQLMLALAAELDKPALARKIKYLRLNENDLETNHPAYSLPVLSNKGEVRLSFASPKITDLDSSLLDKLAIIFDLYVSLVHIKKQVSYRDVPLEEKAVLIHTFAKKLNDMLAGQLFSALDDDSEGASILVEMDKQLSVLKYELRVTEAEIQRLFLANVETHCARFLLHIGSKNPAAKPLTIEAARKLVHAYQFTLQDKSIFPEKYLMDKIVTVVGILNQIGTNNDAAVDLDIHSRFQATQGAIRNLENDETIEAHKNGWVINLFKPVVTSTESGCFLNRLRSEVANHLQRHNALYFNVSNLIENRPAV